MQAAHACMRACMHARKAHLRLNLPDRLLVRFHMHAVAPRPVGVEATLVRGRLWRDARHEAALKRCSPCRADHLHVLQRAAAVLVEQRKDLVDHVGRVGDTDMEARCAELFFVDEPILVHVEHVKQV